MLKKLAATAALLSCSLPVLAGGGPLDGIYQCTMVAAGQTYSAYYTINGHSDGTSFYVIAAIGNNSPFKGYGTGTATATGFSGTTHDGQSFSVVASGSGVAHTLSGTAGAIVNGQTGTATLSCTQLF